MCSAPALPKAVRLIADQNGNDSMTDPILSRRELDFLLFDWLNVATDGDQRDTYAAVLDLAERLAIDHFLPHYKQARFVQCDVTDPAAVRAVPRPARPAAACKVSPVA